MRGESISIVMSAEWLIVSHLGGTENSHVLFTCPIDRVIYTLSTNVEYELV